MKSVLTLVLLMAGPVLAVTGDLESTFQKLREAESKKDAKLVMKLASDVFAMVREAESQPAPDSAVEKDYRAKHLAYLQDIENYAEYALYSTAVQSPPAVTIELVTEMEKQCPKSEYLDAAYAHYFIALTKTGASSKIPSVAAAALKNFPDNEDLLMVMADTAMNRNQMDGALGYAERLLGVIAKHPVPEGLPAADWQRKRTAMAGRARWIAGVVHSQKQQYFEADRDLRVALSLVQNDPTMYASTLFHLGVANYQLGATIRDRARVLEAASFSEKAAAIKGPLSMQAWRNAQAMKAEAAKIR
jgi:tetratricopeptide (TPR) repeat protein